MFLSVALSGLLGIIPVNTTFVDNFDYLDSEQWVVSTWQSPGNINSNIGIFDADNVSIVDGYLRLELNQYMDSDDNIISIGGEVSTNREFGYGVYEFRMRAGSTSPSPYGEGESISGGISAAFVYRSGAETEIDFEFEGQNYITHLLSWSNGHRRDWTAAEIGSGHENFHTYQIVWRPDSITFYRDDVLIGQHFDRIPDSPAHMLFNHWGTHNQWWGGLSTLNVPRYVYVDYFQFTPIER